MEEFKMIDGIDVDESKITFENSEIIEYEVGEYVSLLYDKGKKKYYVHGIDYDSFDEFSYEIDDEFDGMEFNEVFISKEEFDEFKELIMNLKK